MVDHAREIIGRVVLRCQGSLWPMRLCSDSIYDYSSLREDASPSLRLSVHNEWNRRTDLGGEYVLLSDHFFYFGNQPIELPGEFLGIVKKGPGHKANFSTQYLNDFINWIHSLGYQPASVNGKPQMVIGRKRCSSVCGPRDLQEDEADLMERDSPEKIQLNEEAGKKIM